MKGKIEEVVLVVPGASAIAGLTFRRLRGEADYPAMLRVLQASRQTDQIDELLTLEDLASSYAHLVNCNPLQDIVIVEVAGQMIGYTRTFWQEVLDVGRAYVQEAYLLPEWRAKGLERLLLRHNEQRLREIAAQHPQAGARFFEVTTESNETAKAHLLESEGYQPARYFFDMLRPDLEDIPASPLPDGLEIRSVLPEHYRLIWEADQDAMSDHWDHVPFTEEDYIYWVSGGDPEFQPELWKVAWDSASNQVAGMVLGFILEEENARFNRQRGYTASVSVRRPWRKRGLARALIAETLREFKRRGMSESALSVDSENLSGALHLYESMGFRVVRRKTMYRKPMN